jgi:hypothetical protein
MAHSTIMTALRIPMLRIQTKIFLDPNCLENPDPDPNFDDEMGKKSKNRNFSLGLVKDFQAPGVKYDIFHLLWLVS